MRSDSSKIIEIIENDVVKEKFEKIVTDPKSISYWRKYISGRLAYSIVSKYESDCSVDDILGELKEKIYVRKVKWARKEGEVFQNFMYRQLQNIIRSLEIHLEHIFEKKWKDEDIEWLLDARPNPGNKTRDNYFELNTDHIGAELLGKEDKFAFYRSTMKGQFDPDKFNETVLVILRKDRDTKLIDVYTGHIDRKKREQIMLEHGMDKKEYERVWKRLLYRLRNELPPAYRKMLSITMLMHLIMHPIVQ
jgi:hypothetical protein